MSTKAEYQRISFYSPRPGFFVFSAHASRRVLCNAEGASISEDPPHPYKWLAFIWCHWKCMHFLLGQKKGGKDGEADVANQLSWNGPTSPWGRKTVCLLSCWIALEGGERTAMRFKSVILNWCINYLGDAEELAVLVCWKFCSSFCRLFQWCTCWIWCIIPREQLGFLFCTT